MKDKIGKVIAYIQNLIISMPPEALQWIIILLLAPSLLWLIIPLILSVM